MRDCCPGEARGGDAVIGEYFWVCERPNPEINQPWACYAIDAIKD
jgi:hypothetical protein